jgi:hypothetical protein
MLGETKTYILGEADGVLGVLEVPVGGWFCYGLFFLSSGSVFSP